MISGDWNFVTKVYNENLKWLAPLTLFSKATQIMDATMHNDVYLIERLLFVSLILIGLWGNHIKNVDYKKHGKERPRMDVTLSII